MRFDEMTAKIIEYEQGELTQEQVNELFVALIENNMVQTLQGSYGRTALNLIQSGQIPAPKGWKR